MAGNDHGPFSMEIDISASNRSMSLLFLPFCTFCRSLRKEEGKRTRERVPGGLSIIDKAFDEAPLSRDDDSDQETSLMRLIPASLTRRRMIGVEFPEIYDRR